MLLITKWSLCMQVLTLTGWVDGQKKSKLYMYH